MRSDKISRKLVWRVWIDLPFREQRAHGTHDEIAYRFAAPCFRSRPGQPLWCTRFDFLHPLRMEHAHGREFNSVTLYAGVLAQKSHFEQIGWYPSWLRIGGARDNEPISEKLTVPKQFQKTIAHLCANGRTLRYGMNVALDKL